MNRQAVVLVVAGLLQWVIGLALFIFIVTSISPIMAPTITLSAPDNLLNVFNELEISEISITLLPKGVVDIAFDEQKIATVNYTPESLVNSISLASRYSETQWIINIVKSFPIRAVIWLIYNLSPYGLHVVIQS